MRRTDSAAETNRSGPARPPWWSWRRIESQQRELWGAAILFFVLGDLLTTGVGLQFDPVHEIGPIPALVLETYGFEMLIALKVATIGLCYLGWRWIPPPANLGIPLALAAVGALATLWNALVIGVVVMYL